MEDQRRRNVITVWGVNDNHDEVYFKELIPNCKEVWIARDSLTNSHKNYCFVEFVSISDMNDGIRKIEDAIPTSHCEKV